MTLEEKVRSQALSVAVRAMIGEALYPGAADAGLDRYAVYDLDDKPTRTSTGRDTLRSGTATITLDCYGRSKADARALASAIVAALDGWRDVNSAPRVSTCHLERKLSEYVPPEDGSSVGYFNEPLRFLLQYSQI